MKTRVVDWVDVFIGTAGSGHALVGPQRPHGMVKLCPDTISLPCGGYDYNDPKIIGFSHTHLEGVGGRGGRGNILVTATTGPLEVREKQYASRFSHAEEEASVGYYNVVLLDYGVEVELAATDHAGFHRYGFPETKQGHVLIDLGHTLGGWNECVDATVDVLDATSVAGQGTYAGTSAKANPFTMYFCAYVDTPADTITTWNGDRPHPGVHRQQGSRIGVAFGFEAGTERQVQVKVGISYLSADQARANLEREIPTWDFGRVVSETREAWEQVLGRVRVKGGEPDDIVQFYSSLYRALNAPADYTEFDRFYSGYSGKARAHPTEGHHFYMDDWALWDTFRTTHPLQTILEPERQNDIAQTFVRMFEHGGWLPMATGPGLGYTECMIGHNAIPIILDIYGKGFRGFDVESAYQAMRRTSMEADPAIPRLGTPEIYRTLGYYPGGEEETQEDLFAVSLTLEFIYADWAVAQMAKALGKQEDSRLFAERAQNYRHLFDPAVGFMRRKRRDGTWVEPFNPADSFKNGFCECSSWEYTFFVPHDIQGLINLLGGREVYVKKLDDFFAGGHFNYENETDIQVPYLYTYGGAPWKTQRIIRRTMATKFSSAPAGMWGEDDAGAMSAWHALSCLGLYPACPGDPFYLIGSPIFEEIVIHTEDRRAFTIKAKNASRQNIYIQAATLNGEPYDRPWITHADIVDGTELCFQMGPEPNPQWGSGFGSRPPSMTTETPRFRFSDIEGLPSRVESGRTFPTRLKVENTGARGAELVKVTSGETVAGQQIVFLEPGEKRVVTIECTVYGPGPWTLGVGDLRVGEIQPIAAPARFQYEETTRLSHRTVRCGSGERIEATAWVMNCGGEAAQELIRLCLNGEEVSRKTLWIQSGEKRVVRFQLTLETTGNHFVSVGKAAAAPIDVTTVPCDRWSSFSTTLARYGQAGERLYVQAAGFQSRLEFGILYQKDPVQGDFDAVTRVVAEEFTSPYAPAGIIAQGDMIHLDSSSDYVVIGAMSKRGYFFNCNPATGRYLGEHRYAVGCPEVPYWLKLQKRGDIFAGLYSTDGLEWIALGQAQVPSMAGAHNVGLFVNSASPDLRMVAFDFLTIEKC